MRYEFWFGWFYFPKLVSSYALWQYLSFCSTSCAIFILRYMVSECMAWRDVVLVRSARFPSWLAGWSIGQSAAVIKKWWPVYRNCVGGLCIVILTVTGKLAYTSTGVRSCYTSVHVCSTIACHTWQGPWELATAAAAAAIGSVLLCGNPSSSSDISSPSLQIFLAPASLVLKHDVCYEVWVLVWLILFSKTGIIICFVAIFVILLNIMRYFHSSLHG